MNNLNKYCAEPAATYHQENGTVIVTFLASTPSMSVCPPVRITIMIDPQSLRLFFHSRHETRLRSQAACASPTFICLHPTLRHIVQPDLVPLRALTRLPLRSAYVAEMGATSASHVIAAMSELDDVLAGGTGLPVFRDSQVFECLDS